MEDELSRDAPQQDQNLFVVEFGIPLSNPEIYIQSAPNNSNETYTFMGLG